MSEHDQQPFVYIGRLHAVSNPEQPHAAILEHCFDLAVALIQRKRGLYEQLRLDPSGGRHVREMGQQRDA